MINWEPISRSLGFSDERSMWEKLYKTLSIHQLSQRFGVSHPTIVAQLRKHNIQIKGPGGRNRVKFEMDDALLQRVKAEGVKKVAESLNVELSAIYKAVRRKTGGSVKDLKSQPQSTAQPESASPGPGETPDHEPNQ